MKEICIIPKDLFKPFFDTIKVITQSIEAHVEDGILWLVTTDTAHTSMARMQVSCRVLNPFTFKIDLDKINKMSVDGDFNFHHDDNVMIVKSGSTNYKIPIVVDTSVKTFEFKELNYTGSIVLSKEDIKKIIHIVNYVKSDKDLSKALFFTLQDGVFIVKDKHNTIDHRFEGLITRGSGSSLFSLDLIEDMCSAYNQYESFCLHISDDHPCMLKMQREGLCAEILIAPRLNEDE
jgi:hypothetical protein